MGDEYYCPTRKSFGLISPNSTLRQGFSLGRKESWFGKFYKGAIPLVLGSCLILSVCHLVESKSAERFFRRKAIEPSLRV